MKTTHNRGVAAQIGRYSDGVEVSGKVRWLHTSGTPGIRPDGTAPETIEAQADQAWKNILAILEAAGMEVADIVKVTQYLIHPEDKPAYIQVRSRYLGEARPAFMLSVVTELIRPDILVEIEVIAAKTEGDSL
ncbi:RidA family protein [Ktedonobacter racemifer]|uniref:Endoribonuclease L-PSP n=1 Tax=Ktedonobacter racemifer DSM 44963 TaxID=485913 RepID=D6TV05_KTERA|nr:RidA family protein [Ktedonobacter racemifer]EFH85331.1 Endoribonuclease L-PSP [Ktedonobacter racemifer DSM 44963]